MKTKTSHTPTPLEKYNELHLEVKRLADTYGYCHPMTERAVIARDTYRAKLYAHSEEI